MTHRSTQLLDTANEQIAELHKLLSTHGQETLNQPCPGRENLGNGTIGATVQHLAQAYQLLAQFIQPQPQAPDSRQPAGHRDHQGPHRHQHDDERASLRDLLQQLSTAATALGALAELTDQQLDAVPPAGGFRYCDGQRPVEHVITNVLRHQQHHVDAAVKKAMA